MKFLERIAGSRKRLYQFTAIDDCTRIRVLKIYDACNQSAAIRFMDEVRRRLPFRVLVVQTDSGAEFQSRFHWHLESNDIRHVYIKPRTPHLNGKVERSHRVDEQEFYQLLDKDGIADDIHLFNDKLREWEDYYNYHRPHGALDGHRSYGASPWALCLSRDAGPVCWRGAGVSKKNMRRTRQTTPWADVHAIPAASLQIRTEILARLSVRNPYKAGFLETKYLIVLALPTGFEPVLQP